MIPTNQQVASYTHSIVLDMDGVVLDSEAIKIAAFARLFSTYPDHLALIDHYDRAHRGIPRREKFIYVLTAILDLPATEDLLQHIGTRYHSLLESAMADAPLIKGIESFLQHTQFAFFLNSSAPLEEVTSQMQTKSLSHYFQTIYGYPHTKTEALQSIKQMFPQRPVVFLGDAWADYQASQIAGVQFIGVNTSAAATFDGINIPIIKDFSDIGHVTALIEACTQNPMP